MENKFDIAYINERIESMLIAKISHHRLQVREKFLLRNIANGLEDSDLDKENRRLTLKGSVRDLKVWLKISDLVDEALYPETRNPNKIGDPYPTYMAKKLTQ